MRLSGSFRPYPRRSPSAFGGTDAGNCVLRPGPSLRQVACHRLGGSRPQPHSFPGSFLKLRLGLWTSLGMDRTGHGLAPAMAFEVPTDLCLCGPRVPVVLQTPT